MNHSDEYKAILLLPPRQGARAIMGIFNTLGFISDQSNNPKTPTHSLHISEDKLNYNIIASKRHPYLRYKSIIKWLTRVSKIEFKTHEEALESALGVMGDYETILNIHKLTPIQYYIDTENMVEDILKIPFIVENQSNILLQKELNRNAYNNSYKEIDTPLTSEPLPDYVKEQIYNRYQEYFETFNYQK